MKVLILGASGMLGTMVLEVLGQDDQLEIAATWQSLTEAQVPAGVRCHRLDAATATIQDLTAILEGADWAVNCIGVIKHHIHDGQSEEVQQAIRVNGLFPHLLARSAAATNCRILQIATDCVYSGAKGKYLESDSHDPLDVYGKTKSLGEVRSPGFHNLRCSIIGPERKDKRSLLEWFLSHAKGARVIGYLNHYWNGVTTLQFAKICRGIIHSSAAIPGLAHVVPGDILSKGALLQAIAASYGRQDLEIDIRPVPQAIDRSLATADPRLNLALWQAAGYPEPPDLAAMVEELAQFSQSLKANLK